MRKISLICAGFLLASVVLCIAQQEALAKRKSSKTIDQWMQQLQSKDWREREAAVGYLATLEPEEKTDQVKIALIHELENELKRDEAHNLEPCPGSDCGDLGGEEGYLSSLMEIVADMGDDRAFPLFVGIGSPTFLVKFGDKGVNAILDKLDTMTKCNEEEYPVQVLSETLQVNKKGYVAQGATRQRIKKAMINALEKSEHPRERVEWYGYRSRECANVRIHVVRALGHLAESGDTDVVPVIRSIAEKDAYALGMGRKGYDQMATKKFIVREEAQGILEKLKTK